MSFDLGRWWEKLNLDIIKGWLSGDDGGDDDGDYEPDVPPDLSLPDDYHDPAWDDPDPYGLTDPPEPDPEQGGPFDDLDIPGLPLPGDGEATPGWSDGPRLDFTWPLD
ncbi:MAG: hypothetical protein AAGJ68_15130 [Pseudomonadota bacterium]